MAEIEREQNIEVDEELAAFMKANMLDNKRENIQTEYTCHALGLNVCADTLVRCCCILLQGGHAAHCMHACLQQYLAAGSSCWLSEQPV